MKTHLLTDQLVDAIKFKFPNIEFEGTHKNKIHKLSCYNGMLVINIHSLLEDWEQVVLFCKLSFTNASVKALTACFEIVKLIDGKLYNWVIKNKEGRMGIEGSTVSDGLGDYHIELIIGAMTHLSSDFTIFIKRLNHSLN